MVLIIDNYDSFTYNLAQYLGELGEELEVRRNDEVSVDEVLSIAPDAVLISPGPGRPEGAGISMELLREVSDSVPVLGVCLGHQCIAACYGARVVQSDRIMHGKVSEVEHYGDDLFEGIPSPFTATRYHSLVVDPATISQPLEVIASTSDGEVMALRVKGRPVWGVQFHPESILTQGGKSILRNFLKSKRTERRA